MICPMTYKECEHPNLYILKKGKWCDGCEHNRDNMVTLLLTSKLKALIDFEEFR